MNLQSKNSTTPQPTGSGGRIRKLLRHTLEKLELPLRAFLSSSEEKPRPEIVESAIVDLWNGQDAAIGSVNFTVITKSTVKKNPIIFCHGIHQFDDTEFFAIFPEIQTALKYYRSGFSSLNGGPASSCPGCVAATIFRKDSDESINVSGVQSSVNFEKLFAHRKYDETKHLTKKHKGNFYRTFHKLLELSFKKFRGMGLRTFTFLPLKLNPKVATRIQDVVCEAAKMQGYQHVGQGVFELSELFD